MGSHTEGSVMHIDLSARYIDSTSLCVFFQTLTMYKSDFCEPQWHLVSANPYTDLFVRGNQSFCIRILEQLLR